MMIKENRLAYISAANRLKFAEDNPELSDKEIEERFGSEESSEDLFRTIFQAREGALLQEKARTTEGRDPSGVAEQEVLKAQKAASKLVDLQRSGVNIFEGFDEKSISNLFGKSGAGKHLTLSDIAEGRTGGFLFSTGQRSGDAIGSFDRLLLTNEFNRQNQELQAGLRTQIDPSLKRSIFPDVGLRQKQLARTAARDRGEDVPTGVEVGDPNLIDPTDPIAARTKTPERTTSKERGQTDLIKRFQDDVASGKLTQEQAERQIAALRKKGQFDNETPGFTGVDPVTGIQFSGEPGEEGGEEEQGMATTTVTPPPTITTPEEKIDPNAEDINQTMNLLNETENFIRQMGPSIYAAFLPGIQQRKSQIKELQTQSSRLLATLPSEVGIQGEFLVESAQAIATGVEQQRIAKESSRIQLEAANLAREALIDQRDTQVSLDQLAIQNQFRENNEAEIRTRRLLNRHGVNTDSRGLEFLNRTLQQGQETAQALIMTSNFNLRSVNRKITQGYTNDVNSILNNYQSNLLSIQSGVNDELELLRKEKRMSLSDKRTEEIDIIQREQDEKNKLELEVSDKVEEAHLEMIDQNNKEVKNNLDNRKEIWNQYVDFVKNSDTTSESGQELLREFETQLQLPVGSLEKEVEIKKARGEIFSSSREEEIYQELLELEAANDINITPSVKTKLRVQARAQAREEAEGISSDELPLVIEALQSSNMTKEEAITEVLNEDIYKDKDAALAQIEKTYGKASGGGFAGSVGRAFQFNVKQTASDLQEGKRFIGGFFNSLFSK